jgi:hypothetical protein
MRFSIAEVDGCLCEEKSLDQIELNGIYSGKPLAISLDPFRDLTNLTNGSAGRISNTFI